MVLKYYTLFYGVVWCELLVSVSDNEVEFLGKKLMELYYVDYYYYYIDETTSAITTTTHYHDVR